MKSKSKVNSADSKTGCDRSMRASFPEDEAVRDWLPMLLDAYSIIDEGVAEGIRREEKLGRKFACEKGCSSCCYTHINIPVYPLELVGITWYVTEKVPRPQRKKLARQLKNYKELGSCPFLVDDICSIYPLRPMACRQFNVSGKACAEGEDTYYTRREDVLTPIKKYVDRAFDATLPFYGATNRAQRRSMIKSGAIHVTAREMLDCDWSSLPDKMVDYEKQHPKQF